MMQGRGKHCKALQEAVGRGPVHRQRTGSGWEHEWFVCIHGRDRRVSGHKCRDGELLGVWGVYEDKVPRQGEKSQF